MDSEEHFLGRTAPADSGHDDFVSEFLAGGSIEILKSVIPITRHSSVPLLVLTPAIYQSTDAHPNQQPPLQSQEQKRTDELRPAKVVERCEYQVVQDSFDLFSDIDEDHNDYLSKAEVGEAVQNPRLHAGDSQAVAVLYHAFDELKRFNDDEYFRESEVSKEDLRLLDLSLKVIRTQILTSSLAKHFTADEAKFKQCDTNKNGYLGRNELQSALNRHPLGDSDQAAVKYMIQEYEQMQSVFGMGWSSLEYGISAEDAERHNREIQESDFGKAINKAKLAVLRTKDYQEAACENLYGIHDEPKLSIVPDAIEQGLVGNCFFEAAVASLAHSNYQAIMNMIKDNKDGTYTVTFPGDRANPITVSKPSEAEMGLFNNNRGHGLWANVLEKAFGEYLQKSRSARLGHTPEEGAGEGGFSEDAFKLLTGREAITVSPQKIPLPELGRTLADAFLMQNAVSCSSMQTKRERTAGSGLTPKGFYRSHEYSVLRFVAGDKDGGAVTIRNPWGGKDGTPNGTMVVTLKEFRDNFNAISIAQ